MDSGIIGALIGIAFLTLVNIAVIAYTYGKITQTVAELCRRVLRLERIYNNKGVE
jgi:hypothetical protein